MSIKLPLFAIAILTGLLASTAQGYGVAWWQDENLELLDVSGLEQAHGLRGLNRIGGVYYPGEEVTVTIASPAEPDRNLAEGHIEVIGFDTGQYDPTETGFVHAEQARKIALRDVPVKRTPVSEFRAGQHGLTGGIEVPDAYGMYAIVLERADGTRTLIGGIARVMKPTPRKNELPQIQAEYGLGGRRGWVQYFTDDHRCEALARLGIELIRRELSSNVASDDDDPVNDGLDAMMAAAEKHGLKVMLTLGAHNEQELPWNYPGKPISRILPPDRDPELRQWYENLARKYWTGGEAGLWGVEHWNEPWEPFGISGWGGDSIRYRQLLEAIHDGVKAVSADINVMAAGSVMNTEDKFLTGESRKHINMIDILTDHYVSLHSAYGARVADKHGVITGETETWGVHSQVLAAQFMSQFLSNGQRFINPATPTMMWAQIGQDVVHGNTDDSGVVTPMPASVTFAAWNALIQNRVFERIVFTEHLPYLFQFGPDDDARFVMIGKLTSTGSGRLRDYPWHQMLEGPNGTLEVRDEQQTLEIRDISGNVIEPDGNGTYVLDMDTRAYFVTPTQDAATAIQTLGNSRLEGLRHMHIAPQMLSSIPSEAEPATLPVQVHNLYNREITGQLGVTSLTDQASLSFEKELRLGAGETATVNVPVRTAVEGGLPLRFAFVPADGEPEEHREVVHVTGIEKRTMPVKGDGAAWDRIRPVQVLAAGGESDVDPIERIWLPFIERDETATESKRGEVRLAWDEENLYIHARVDDHELTPKKRLAEWDEDQYFWGEHIEEQLEPLEPYAKFLRFRPSKGNKQQAREDPDWPEYQAFLDENPELKKLANNSFVRAYFYVKAERPDASLDEISFHYCQFAPNFQQDLPFNGDTFQFAFDFDAPEERMTATHDLEYPVEKMPRSWVSVPDSDYEYALYLCEDGRPELWRLLAPGVPRGHHYPHQERGDNPQRAIEAECSVDNTDGRTTYRVAIPWSELGIDNPQPGMDFGFTFRFNADAGGVVEFGHDAGATKMNGLTLHPYWQPSPSNTIRWQLR